jgi:hypothetical protein
VDTSDLSGSLIEPDAKAEVIIRSVDGRARRITVTAAEAANLASIGKPIGGPWRGIKAFARRNWRTVAWWAFTLAVVSLLLPAATKQWADHQAALTLKSNMISDISTSTVGAVRPLQDTVGMKGENQVLQARNHALDAWVAGEASIDPVYHVYFNNTPALNTWNEYRGVIYTYILFACCDENKNDDVDLVQQYFQRYSLPPPTTSAATSGSDPWLILRSSSINDPAFRVAYQSVGQSLLRRREALLEELIKTPASGYSSGFIDFWRDVIPVI